MSPNPTAEQPRVASPDDPGPLTPPKELSADEKRRLVAEWRRVLAGEIDKPMPPPPPAVEWAVETTYRDWQRQGVASEKARLDLLDFLTLHYYYWGHEVATYTTKEGRTWVLAYGEAEVDALLEGVPEEELRGVAFGVFDPLPL
jgi:hypothetical protein